MAEQSCKECGCQCRSCDQSTLHLHVEIENLKQRLVERERHIVTMETNFLSEADKFPDGEYAALTEELLTWQEKYSRLYESYKRVQKVNQGLEDKLLRVVDKFESEKGVLTRDVASLTQRLVDARFNVNRYQEENERYRNDLNLAIQFLQCKPANFVPQKFEQLPTELQQKVRSYMSSKRRPSDCNGVPPKVERRTIKVPIPTFPPTAMVYSVNKAPSDKDMSDEEREVGDGKPPVDIVSAAILAKILEERERERLQTKHCSTCTCPAPKVDVSTQTEVHILTSNSPSSPALMNLRYSSSLLGSGEVSQVLICLGDDPSGMSVPSSQSPSAKQSPRNSIVASKSEEEAVDSKIYSNVNNINRNFESSGWEDWNINGADSQKLQDVKQVESSNSPTATDTSQMFPRKDINMPKVSINNSPGICRVNSTVMPSSAGAPLASSWCKAETLTPDPVICKKLKDSNKTNHKIQHSANSKPNQSRLLPETKLYASGDTLEVHPMYSVECERRLGQISLKSMPQVSSTSSQPPRDKKDVEPRPSGPRPCSLRFQAGSNNILLDNAQSYQPILYTSRQANNANILTSSPRENEALVHSTEVHFESASSSDELSSPSKASDPTVSSSTTSNPKSAQSRAHGSRAETGV